MVFNSQTDFTYLLYQIQPVRHLRDTSRRRDFLNRIKGQVNQGPPEQGQGRAEKNFKYLAQYLLQSNQQLISTIILLLIIKITLYVKSKTQNK